MKSLPRKTRILAEATTIVSLVASAVSVVGIVQFFNSAQANNAPRVSLAQSSPLPGSTTSTATNTTSSSSMSSSSMSSSSMSSSASGATSAPSASGGRSSTPTPSTKPKNYCDLVDATGLPVKPSNVVAFGADLFFLSPDAIWYAPRGMDSLSRKETITLQKLPAPDDILNFQELVNFVVYEPRHSIVILDKTGDLFEYVPASHKWSIFRKNMPFLGGAPDPEFIDVAVLQNQIAVLDPERNNIWKTSGSAVKMLGSFKTVLPWKVQKGDVSLGDAMAITSDGTNSYVMKRAGVVTEYSAGTPDAFGVGIPFRQNRPAKMRPSRICTGSNTPVFIVERENNRVTAIDKHSGKSLTFYFPGTSDLRGLIPLPQGFWIVNGSQIVIRSLGKPDDPRTPVQAKRIDSRVEGMRIPIAGITLPHHPGVYPGARRLYRFGIHAGMDFFNTGGKVKVVVGTPALAADAGKIIRTDNDFKMMTAKQFDHIMSECYSAHKTSAHNEDLFRGCQVWIDHGNNLITKYAHLTKTNPKLKKGQFVTGGDLIGFVGVTGTGQELPGRAKFPHLHFEIWLDGKYLGYGLTQAETVGVYEDIFGNSY